MKTLAIKGHATRGKEVIELLEILGGRNSKELGGDVLPSYYYIDSNGEIEFTEDYSMHEFILFTLEEFLEEFPYKVGDKVVTRNGSIGIIDNMSWSCSRMMCYGKVDGRWWKLTDSDLRHYKEEPMEGKVKSIEIVESHCENEVAIEFDPSKYEMQERDGKYFVVKKGPQYPKTYEECCKVLGFSVKNGLLHGDSVILAYKIRLIAHLQELLICRDAYWKLAGDWKPDWANDEKKFIIEAVGYKKAVWTTINTCRTFAFPTEEMRDAFCENFKELIEKCKELL